MRPMRTASVDAQRAGSSIEVEIVLFRSQDGCLGYRWERGPLMGSEHPDHAAQRLAGGPRTSVSHSTSWRFEQSNA